jgi:hypothetical protein
MEQNLGDNLIAFRAMKPHSKDIGAGNIHLGENRRSRVQSTFFFALFIEEQA